MKCNAEDLIRVIGMGMPIISSRATADICKSFRFDGKKLTCTNYISFGEFDLPGDLDFDKDIIVNAKQLESIAKYLKGSVDISTDEKSMILKDDNGEFKLPLGSGTMAAPDDRPDDEEFIESEDVPACINIARAFTQKVGPVQAYQGVLMRGDAIYATDTKIMVQIKMDGDLGEDKIIPVSEVPNICKESDVKIASTERRIYFKYSGALISTSKMNATFPNVSKVVDLPYDEHLTMNKEELHGAVRQCMSLSEEGDFIKVNLSAEEGKIRVSATTSKGEVNASIRAEGKSSLNCNLNGFIMNSFMSCTSSKLVGISHYSSVKDGTIRMRARLGKSNDDRLIESFISPCGLNNTKTSEPNKEEKF